MFIINDTTNNDVIFPSTFGRGHDPGQVPSKRPMFSPPSQIKKIPKSDWIPMIRERKKYKMGLRDLFKDKKIGPVKDQNGQGFCWSYSVARACEYARMIMGLEYVALSGHSVACKIKDFHDQGGWCGLSREYAGLHGYIPETLWPAKSMSRVYDTAANWAEAEKYKIIEDYVDLTVPVYDQTIPYDLAISCLLQNIPVIFDLNWWGHSVLVCDVDEVDGEEAPDGDNSWTPGWGDNGTFRLQGSKKIPDGAVAIRVLNPA